MRRGFLAAIPVGGALLVDLEIDAPAAGAISTGALLAGFVAFDAPPRARFLWQVLTAPAIGMAAAVGALTGETAWLAVLTMTLFASVAGLSVAVSPRLSLAAATVVLALLLAQGLSLNASEALSALLLGLAGAVSQALFTLLAALHRYTGGPLDLRAGMRRAARAVQASIDTRSPNLRHALRWGVALGIGTALYHAIDLGEHGYWIPLTVLFVLRPTPDETTQRIAMRAVGTLVGLALATPLGELLGQHPIPDAVAIATAAAFSFALLAIEYALFTTAITAFAVIEAHALGQPALEAADERALGTAMGIAVVAAAVFAGRPRRAGPPPAVTPRP
ncbi:MAG TPA: FUSC family protein [Solirubrobacterales bacterium]|nr:FUSC family protein [Solirubrobacterales bacterium]